MSRQPGSRRGVASCSTWRATTDPPPSLGPCPTTGSHRTRDQPAPACPARAARQDRPPACSHRSCTAQPPHRTSPSFHTRRPQRPEPAGTRTAHPCSPPVDRTRPTLTSLSATSSVIPSMATIRRPANQHPGVPAASQRSRNPLEQDTEPVPIRGAHEPGRSPTSKATAPARVAGVGPRQPVGHQPQHVLIRAVRMQRQPDREIRHRLRRQRPMPLLTPTALSNHLVHHISREHLRHHPHRHHIRQTPSRLRLHPTSTRHDPKLHQSSSNWTVLRLARRSSPSGISSRRVFGTPTPCTKDPTRTVDGKLGSWPSPRRRAWPPASCSCRVGSCDGIRAVRTSRGRSPAAAGTTDRT